MKNFRPRLSLLPLTALLALSSSCGPSGGSQSVSFVLDLSSDRASQLAFTVNYSSGGFVGSDGDCVVGSAAGPRAALFEREPSAEARERARRNRLLSRASVVAQPSAEPVKVQVRGVATTTTSVTSTSTTTTSTTTTFTTTTLPRINCDVLFRFDTAVGVASLQWETAYSAANGSFAGEGALVECAGLVSGTIVSFNDDESAQTLGAGLIGLSNIDGPFDLAECQFVSTAAPTPSDFPITLLEATDFDLNPIVPAPSIIVSSVTCDGVVVTTTTLDDTSTTTTMEPNSGTCGNGTVNAGEECDDGNVISGDGCTGNCDAEYAFSAVDNNLGELTIRIVNGRGIPPGATVAYCKFDGDVADADLTVTTINCGLPSGDPCDPDTDVEVTVSTTMTTTTTTTTTTSTTTTTVRK